MTDDVLTPAERALVQELGGCYTRLELLVPQGPNREGDLAEARAAIHVVQRMILAQAAARAYPAEFRLLGTVIPVRPRSASQTEMLLPPDPRPGEADDADV
jgi:hypothetical protein